MAIAMLSASMVPGDLANHSGVSQPTVARLESVDGELGGREGTTNKIRAAIESAGIDFIEENGGGPGVRLRKLRGGFHLKSKPARKCRTVTYLLALSDRGVTLRPRRHEQRLQCFDLGWKLIRAGRKMIRQCINCPAVHQLQSMQFRRRSEKLDPDQLHLAFEDIEQAIAASEARGRQARPLTGSCRRRETSRQPRRPRN